MPRVEPADVDVEKARRNRDDRWHARELAQRLTRKGNKKDDRLRFCGRRMSYGSESVRVTIGSSGVASYSGVQTCGGVWVCAMCSSRIRAGRNDELAAALAEHERRGGGVEFVTLTERHYWGDRLPMLVDGAANGWRDVQRDHGVRATRKRLPWKFVRALEVKLSLENGWHAHLHVVLLTERPWSPLEREEARLGVESAWIDSLERRTGRRPDLERAVVWKGGADSKRAAAYLTKPQESNGWGLSAELTRGDVKGSSDRSLYPLDLPLIAAGELELVTVTPREAQRAAQARKLWHEYVDGTRGRAMLTWSQGLKKDLLAGAVELTDDELAEVEPEERVEVGRLCGTEFFAVRRAGLLYTLLVAVEDHGRTGFDYIRQLALQRCGANGWLTDDEVHRFCTWEGRDEAA